MDKTRKLTVGISLAIHAGLIALMVLVFDVPDGSAVAPAPEPMDLFLPPMQVSTRSIEVQETEEPVEEVKPVEAVEPEPEEVVEPTPALLPVVEDAVEAVAPEVVVAKAPEPEKPKPPKPPKPKPRRETQKPPEKPPEPAQQSAPSVAAGVANAPIAQAAITGNANAEVSGGGNPGASSDYIAQIIQRVSEKKPRFPARALSSGAQGKPVVRFRIDRNGKVLSRELVASSGRPDLDEAALKTIDRADPFPPMPPEMTGAEKAFTLPIDFNIKKR